jgi:hypothetical protein
MLKRLVCWLRGHEITIDVEADDKSVKATATCRRCGKVLGVTTALAMRILCWLGFHKWETTVYEVRSPGMLVIGTQHHQLQSLRPSPRQLQTLTPIAPSAASRRLGVSRRIFA